MANEVGWPVQTAQVSCSNTAAPLLRDSSTSALPRLPVPPLHQSLAKYLQALRPLLSDAEYAATSKVVESFSEGDGPHLQELLERRASSIVDSSWLADWWLHVAYLDSRLPVVVNTSPGMLMPLQFFPDDRSWLAHASRIVCGALDFMRLINESALPVDFLGKHPLCMSQYGRIFSACRVPGVKRDSFISNGGYPGRSAFRHIVVLYNNRFYAVDVLDGAYKPAGEAQVLEQLSRVIELGQTAVGSPIGVLTTERRDTWANVYGDLVAVPGNAGIVSQIQNALFVLCLDGPDNAGTGKVADTLSSAAEQLFHGGHPMTAHSANRWFDKTLQFIVGRSGTVGVNYEHSPSEGVPIATLVNHVVQYKSSSSATLELPAPIELRLTLTASIENSIMAAVKSHAATVANVQLKVVDFTNFGSDFVKSQQLSPDAFIQLALQLAYYKMNRKPCSTHESGSMRRFLHGRTETIRSCSTDSVKFTAAMCSPSATAEERGRLLRAAVETHKRSTEAAISGQAFDRHLLGLKLVALETGIALPALYSDDAYCRTLLHRISSSQVSAKTDCVMFFGPKVPDGYGFCYNPRPTHILFGVTAFNSCEETDALKLADAVTSSLCDMRELLLSLSPN